MYIFWKFFSIKQRLINYNNFVAVLSFVSLAIFCLATEHFSNIWVVYFWIWLFFQFSLKCRSFLCSYWRIMQHDCHERTKDFFICRCRVIIVYNSLNRSKIMWFFIFAGIFTVTSHPIFRPPWTRGERQKFVDVNGAVTFAVWSNITW